jgi:hypothetical protein
MIIFETLLDINLGHLYRLKSISKNEFLNSGKANCNHVIMMQNNYQ